MEQVATLGLRAFLRRVLLRVVAEDHRTPDHVVAQDGRASEDPVDIVPENFLRKKTGHDFRRPTVLVVGNEREGLGERVRAQCDAIVAIKGSGAVESLNVAVAASVLVSELVR